MFLNQTGEMKEGIWKGGGGEVKYFPMMLRGSSSGLSIRKWKCKWKTECVNSQ